MKRTCNLLMLLFLSGSLFSTNYTFDGAVDAEWTNPDNWDVYPGLIIEEGDIVYINADCNQVYEFFEFYGDVIISEEATLSVCGTLDLFGSLTNNGTLFSDGYLAIHESAVLTNEGTMTGFGYFVDGEMINNGLLDNCGFGDMYGSVINNGTIIFLDIFFLYGTFTNSEAGLIEEGFAEVSGEFLNEGTVNTVWFDNSGTINNSGVMNDIDYYSWTESILTNSGTLNAVFLEINEGSGSNTGTINAADFFALWEYTSFDNSGTILALNYQNFGLFSNSGDLTVTGESHNGYLDYPFDGLSHIVNDGTITNQGTFYNNDTIFNNLNLINEGVFLGSGVIIGDIIIDSSISPGNSPGIFSVEGDYTQTAGSELIIEIDDSPTSTAGEGYDQVDVSGNADLAGTLTVVTNYSGNAIGDTYPIFLYGSRSGTDFILNAPDPGPNLMWTIVYESDRILLIVDSALPVTLGDFKLKAMNLSNELQWTTESEVNNEGFEILRSKDGSAWERMGFVAGAGTTLSEQKYSFADRAPLAGTSYYKLKQIDFNGDYAFSNVLSSHRKSRLSLYPNPAADFIILNTGKKSTYQIFDQTGRVLREGTVNGNEQIDVSSLTSGNYLFIIEGETLQFSKQ